MDARYSRNITIQLTEEQYDNPELTGKLEDLLTKHAACADYTNFGLTIEIELTGPIEGDQDLYMAIQSM